MISINKLQVRPNSKNDTRANPEIKCSKIMKIPTPWQPKKKEIESKKLLNNQLLSPVNYQILTLTNKALNVMISISIQATRISQTFRVSWLIISLFININRLRGSIKRWGMLWIIRIRVFLIIRDRVFRQLQQEVPPLFSTFTMFLLLMTLNATASKPNKNKLITNKPNTNTNNTLTTKCKLEEIKKKLKEWITKTKNNGY